MQVLLVNLFTGTVEQRCSVIRTRACAVDSYDLDPDAAYSLYGTMDSSLDPVHYAFNMTFTGQSIPQAPSSSPTDELPTHGQLEQACKYTALHCFSCDESHI